MEEFKFGTWHPIETAPKDGTRILGFCGKYVDIVYWEEKERLNNFVWMTDSCADFGGFENPTHWMPLPPAPNE